MYAVFQLMAGIPHCTACPLACAAVIIGPTVFFSAGKALSEAMKAVDT